MYVHVFMYLSVYVAKVCVYLYVCICMCMCMYVYVSLYIVSAFNNAKKAKSGTFGGQKAKSGSKRAGPRWARFDWLSIRRPTKRGPSQKMTRVGPPRNLIG